MPLQTLLIEITFHENKLINRTDEKILSVTISGSEINVKFIDIPCIDHPHSP